MAAVHRKDCQMILNSVKRHSDTAGNYILIFTAIIFISDLFEYSI